MKKLTKDEIGFLDEQGRYVDLEEILIEEFNICGCGCPEDTFKFIYDFIQLYNDSKRYDRSFEENQKRYKEFMEKHWEEAHEYILHTLNENSEILEHGSSVFGSWLNTEKKELYEVLESYVKGVR